jgi:ElaB/YqjD/DUF883 family membrane-anchored ribosome-binding protein
MGEDPGQIRQDIENTRERMGETVEALGYKADVPGRAKEAISSRRDRAAGIARENPLGLAIGAAAVGFVAGMVIPSTRVEDEKIGPLADDVKEKAKETGQEAMERGKEVAQKAAESAKETAQEAGREQAEAMRAGSGARSSV